MKMNMAELKTFLLAAIPARLAVLIQGAPGIGKSEGIHQTASDSDSDFIITHPAVEDPTDAKGLPFATGKGDAAVATFLPFGALRKARAATKSTVWLVEDLGQASPAVQAAYMPLFDSARGHNDLLGAGAEYITFIAATNRRADRAGVSGILEPVKSRFASIVELVPDLASWCDWAIGHDVPTELIAFLRFKPDLLSAFNPSADLSNSPMPRTWAAVSRILKLGLSGNVLASALSGAVGEGASAELLAYLKLVSTLPSIDAILLNADTHPIPHDPAVLYAISTALAHRATDQNFDRVCTYAQRMTQAQRAEYAALTMHDTIKRHPKLTSSAAYVKLVTGEFGRIITGEA